MLQAIACNDRIDEGRSLRLTKQDEYIRFVIKSGEHTISINSKKSIINIGENGGMLNLEKRDFVIFPIKYNSNDEVTRAMINTDFPIIVDSLVIYEKDLASNQEALIKLLKNQNAKGLFSYNLEKIDKNKLFIDRNWDYGINDSLPDSITVETTAEKGIVERKRKIIDANTFVILAQMLPNYKVEVVHSKELVNLIKNYTKDYTYSGSVKHSDPIR